MSLAKLENWEKTGHGLHGGALLLGAVQRLTQPPQPAYLELGLEVTPERLSTGPLPAGGHLGLDFISSSLVYSAARGSGADFPLNGRSQADVFTELFGHLASGELQDVLPAGKDLFERVSLGIAARGGRYKPPKREILFDETPIEIDSKTARNYWRAFQEVHTGIGRFVDQLDLLRTPLVVWPEHFDLSTLLFLGNEIDEGKPHLNFGFAPYSEGIEFPYLYAYAYPYPDRYQPPALPAGAYWNTQYWTGAVVPYEVIAEPPNSAEWVSACCREIYQGLRPLLK